MKNQQIESIKTVKTQLEPMILVKLPLYLSKSLEQA